MILQGLFFMSELQTKLDQIQKLAESDYASDCKCQSCKDRKRILDLIKELKELCKSKS